MLLAHGAQGWLAWQACLHTGNGWVSFRPLLRLSPTSD